MRKRAKTSKEQQLPPKEFYSLKEVASILDVSERTMQDVLKRQDILGIKIKGQWRVSLAELNRLRQSKTELSGDADG